MNDERKQTTRSTESKNDADAYGFVKPPVSLRVQIVERKTCGCIACQCGKKVENATN